MAVKNVDLTVSQIINDLNNGLTWLKKDDLGYGSIEVKYGATPTQIMAIKKHPKLKDAETSITIFNIIDDTKEEVKAESKEETKECDMQPVLESFAPIQKVLDESFNAFSNL